jgi:hypothetical protein
MRHAVLDLVRDYPKGHQMTRQIALRIADLLIGHAKSERYPTRSVEYMLAWMIIGWSFVVAIPGPILTGPIYSYMTFDAPEWLWATIGLTVGFLRLFALIRNGGWSKSPYLRLIGACLGFNFWLILTVLYGAAVLGGAQLSPNFGCLPVFMFFEAYSSFRCGQDARGV